MLNFTMESTVEHFKLTHLTTPGEIYQYLEENKAKLGTNYDSFKMALEETEHEIEKYCDKSKDESAYNDACITSFASLLATIGLVVKYSDNVKMVFNQSDLTTTIDNKDVWQGACYGVTSEWLRHTAQRSDNDARPNFNDKVSEKINTSKVKFYDRITNLQKNRIQGCDFGSDQSSNIFWERPVRQHLGGRTETIDKIINYLAIPDNTYISLSYSSNNGGHSVGLAKVQGSNNTDYHYVFFDPNLGEIKLDNDAQLKEFLKDWYVSMVALHRENDFDNGFGVHTDLAKYRVLKCEDDKIIFNFKALFSANNFSIKAANELISNISTLSGLLELADFIENRIEPIPENVKIELNQMIKNQAQKLEIELQDNFWSNHEVEKIKKEYTYNAKSMQTVLNYNVGKVFCLKVFDDLQIGLTKTRDSTKLAGGKYNDQEIKIIDKAINDIIQRKEQFLQLPPENYTAKQLLTATQQHVDIISNTIEKNSEKIKVGPHLANFFPFLNQIRTLFRLEPIDTNQYKLQKARGNIDFIKKEIAETLEKKSMQDHSQDTQNSPH